jgi:lipoprotein-anchoring transpeptidase ErfK/SrfK
MQFPIKTVPKLSFKGWLNFAVALVSATQQFGCTTLEPATSTKEPTRDRAVQLQIFLDSQHFGPGAIDGRIGGFATKALQLFRNARHLPSDSDPDVSHIQPYTSYAITADDLDIRGTMASEPPGLALQKRLPYVTLGEVLGERFHTTEAFLRELNGGTDLNLLRVGAVITVPNVDRPFNPTSFPSQYPKAQTSMTKGRSILVDTHSRMLQIHEEDRIIAAFPITPGSVAHPAPIGEWRIIRAVPWPWYRYDRGVLDRGERTNDFFNLPPGPNSPVGVLWVGLNRQSIGIHGTSSPETIGRAGSAGCIRLANWDAATFYTLAGEGMKVTIQ